jgi:WD40 repeat protein
MLVLQGHKRAIRAVAYAPGKFPILASAGDDGGVRLWNPSDGRNLGTLLFRGHGDGILSLSFSRDGNWLATGDRSGGLTLWDVALQGRHAFHRTRFPVRAVAFAPDGRTVFAATPRSVQTRCLLRWDLHHEQRVTLLDVSPAVTRGEWVGTPRHLALAPGGATAAVADESRVVEIWDLKGVRRQTAFRVAHSVHGLAFNPRDERTLAVATGWWVELWDAANGERRAVCQGHRAGVYCLAFTPDGRSVLSGSADRTARLWDAAGGQLRGAWEWRIGSLHAVAVSADGMTAAAGGKKSEVIVWDLDLPG